MSEEEEFEEFEEEAEDSEEEAEEEVAEDEEETPVVKGAQIPKKTTIVKPVPQQAVPKAPVSASQPVQEQQPQVVAIPRAVPVETMLNEIYDGQQEMRQSVEEIKQALTVLLKHLIKK